MPIGSQPRRARGTVEHPYSALNLRLVLACFGLVVCAGLAVLLAMRHLALLALVLALLAVVAAVDAVVVQLRRRQRRRHEGRHPSLFE